MGESSRRILREPYVLFVLTDNLVVPIDWDEQRPVTRYKDPSVSLVNLCLGVEWIDERLVDLVASPGWLRGSLLPYMHRSVSLKRSVQFAPRPKWLIIPVRRRRALSLLSCPSLMYMTCRWYDWNGGTCGRMCDMC